MAQLTLGDLQDEVGDYVPDYPLAKVARAANNVLRRIHRELGQISRVTFTTVTPYSTGTVTVFQGNATVTGSGTTWQTGWKEALIRISGDATWYNVTFAASGVCTLSSVFAGADGAGLTYQIVFPSVILPSSVLEPIRIWRPGSADLKWEGDENIEELAYQMEPGEPKYWSPASMEDGSSSVDELRIRLTPPPDGYYAFTLACRKNLTVFDPAGADTQKTYLPSYMNEAIFRGTMFHIFDQVDKQDRSRFWNDLYEQSLRELFAQHTAHAVSQMSDGTDIGGLSQVFPVE